MDEETGTRIRIMGAAFDLFCGRGYDRVSLEEIAKKAGCSKGALFHYFVSKYDLAMKTLMWWAESNFDVVIGKTIDSEEPPERVLSALVDFTLDMMSNEKGFIRFFWGVIDEAVKRNDRGTWMKFMKSYMDIISLQYRKLGEEAPDEMALIFMSGLDGLTLYSEVMKEYGRIPDREKLKRALIRTYVGDLGDDER